MPTFPVVEQEFVVHLFAPLDGPQAPRAYAQLQRIWVACREQLGLAGRDIAGLPGATFPAAEAVSRSADGILAFAEGQAGIRQAVARRVHDVLNLSVVLAQPAPEGRRASGRGRLGSIGSAAPPSRRSLGWADHAALWARASPPGADALLGEAHVFLARMPPGRANSVPATAELGQELDRLLPYREDRPRHWWRGGTTTTAGYALWDTGLAADTGEVREIVLAGPADRDEELSAWTWSDRTPAMPPFARYLMHAAKLRYEARLLESWHRTATADHDLDTLVSELSAALIPGHRGKESAGLLQSLRAEASRLTLLDADLARLGQTVSIAQQNLAAQPGCGPDDGPAGMFAADQAMARYISGQVSSDRGYLQIDLNRAKHLRELATESLGQLDQHGAGPGTGSAGESSTGAARARPQARDGAPGPAAEVARRVFVVYGRDGALAKGFFDLLYSVGLQPLEWERLVRPTGTTAPFLGEVVRMAPHLAQANLVLLSPDDIVELHPDLFQRNDHPYERGRAGQARPNVLFELGLAYMAYPERTVIVEVGQLRPIADLGGLNVIRFDGSAIAVKKIIGRLTQAGCPADTSGEDWLDPGRFAGLEAYRRQPGTSKAASDGGS